MDPEQGNTQDLSTQDLKTQAAGLRQTPVTYSERWRRFERLRYRMYLGLLIFVVFVGLPILAVPSLRQRLTERVEVLREAVGHDGRPDPLVAQVGQNTDPFPTEYEIPVLKHRGTPGVVYMADGAYTPAFGQPTASAPTADAGSAAPAGDAAEGSGEPEFRQGTIEQEAYDLVLKTRERVAGMVQGKDPALQFKSWSAARIEEDLYYVRVTFLQSSDKAEIPYIWQVRLGSKQVTPLNYHARSVPN